jgi:endonuclease/exonuclease/phosphatase family metal-dependent hydrolase
MRIICLIDWLILAQNTPNPGNRDDLVGPQQNVRIRLITHNIRYAATNLDKGEKPWPSRAPQLIAQLRFSAINNPESFICLQEVLHSQLKDILSGLNDGKDQAAEWQSIGVARDDGKKQGEYGPILYRPAVWDLKSWETIWLSDTPDRPSRGWDAACTRILTIGNFEHRVTKKVVVAMNTHLDHVGVVARRKSARLIVTEIEKFHSIKQGLACFLAGDFNSEPNQEAYKILNNEASPVEDLRTLIPNKLRYGFRETFTGFGATKESLARIDFLFLNKNRWRPQSYAVLENCFDDVYSSDHRAVVADVILN